MNEKKNKSLANGVMAKGSIDGWDFHTESDSTAEVFTFTKGDRQVLATPDYNEVGLIPVTFVLEAGSKNEDCSGEEEIQYAGKLTADRYIELIRPFLKACEEIPAK